MGSWLGTKNALYYCVLNQRKHLLGSFHEFIHNSYCLDHGLSRSCTKEINAVTKLSVWYKIPIWFQNTVCLKTKDAFPKIQASAYKRYSCLHRPRLICVNIYRVFLKDTTTADSHENLTWKSEFIFFSVSIMIILTCLLCQMQADSSGAEFLSTISKFMKRMNFVVACLRPSQNMKLGIFTGSRAVDGKEMYKKVWCTCKVVVLPCQAIVYLTFSSSTHLKLAIIYDTLWSFKNRIFSGQFQLLLLIASQTFFRLIGSSFVSG